MNTCCDNDNLKIFGCTTWYHVKEVKLDLRSQEAKFMGYQVRIKGYQLWDPKFKKIVLSHDVKFY